ncbi:hypothetical protein, partial [Sinorhizobium meliloti]|uniref:hypothetical protein n=1 Tax=Rhizobium meliloti TaxID=382 RepID=UPI001AECE32F
ASPVPSRLAKKDRFSEQNTSKTLKNRRLWTGTSLVKGNATLRDATKAAAEYRLWTLEESDPCTQ